MRQQFIALNRIEAFVQRLQREMGAAQGQIGREEERRSSEGEQKQDKASQELALPASGAQ